MGCVADGCSGLCRTNVLDGGEENGDVPAWLQPAPLEDHSDLKHGMTCALCRNHYWTGGRASETFLSHL